MAEKHAARKGVEVTEEVFIFGKWVRVNACTFPQLTEATHYARGLASPSDIPNAHRATVCVGGNPYRIIYR